MKQNLRQYIEDRLPREDDKELFRDLWEAYDKGGPDEVRKTVQNRIRKISGA